MSKIDSFCNPKMSSSIKKRNSKSVINKHGNPHKTVKLPAPKDPTPGPSAPTRPVFRSVCHAWGLWLLPWSLWEPAPSPSESAATRARTPAGSPPAAAPTRTAAPRSATPSPARCWWCAAPGRWGTRCARRPPSFSARTARVLRASEVVPLLGRHCFCGVRLVLPNGRMEARRSSGPHPSLQKRLRHLYFQKKNPKETDKLIKAFWFIQHAGAVKTNSSWIISLLLKQRHQLDAEFPLQQRSERVTWLQSHMFQY